MNRKDEDDMLRVTKNKLSVSLTHIRTHTHTVTCTVHARVVTVTGPLGTLTRDFTHIAMDLRVVEMTTTTDEDDATEAVAPATTTTTPVMLCLQVDLWFATRKQLACVRTVCSHCENLFTGVTRGFQYKMRFVYSHFPINVTLTGTNVEIRNFLGEKRVRKVALLPGVDYERSANVKDQIVLSGIDIAAVSLTAARIQQATNIRNKDLRKFLDGIYVSEKGATPEAE
jgi:large subunit ribosomal protein L9e